ncbi:glycosyltransferase involved in cell wall biosynthesis [Flavobacterium cutihirudinis]|uniref:Glycosyltransferase involved in cell wall biosynthesis n=1 Tax=Flavobacterium cutihirudinis TaxID=1265740 RepID=A0A3D9FMB4_9FLAO|nr:glycosyltransferase [Flavobacterium cutihirudinis]RED19586.1 glycosyltransferase involved in cell wall biosynthesis [Flavobacterium cutihirudinis]
MELQKNRIAMVSPSLNVYSETFIQAQKNGIASEVFYYYGGNLPTHLEYYGELLNIKKFLLYKLERKLKFTSFNTAELAFIASLKQNKIQLVFAQYGPVAYRLVKICKYLNIPLISHFHGYDASVFSIVEDCNNYKELFDYSKFIIAVSHSMKKRLIELGCPKDKLIYNPCGPDNFFSTLSPKFSEDTFIGLGRFVEKKAPYYTILAFSKVLEKYPNSKLIIGGNGNLYEVCQNLVKYLKIENNVLLPGVLSKEEFSNYLENSLAFVQHSITAINGDQEGTPVAVLEASGSGLPVIATFHAGIPDVIINGKTGLLVEEHDVDAMAEKMILLLKNKDFAEELGRSGKQRIQSQFSMDRHLQKLDEIIQCSIKDV